MGVLKNSSPVRNNKVYIPKSPNKPFLWYYQTNIDSWESIGRRNNTRKYQRHHGSNLNSKAWNIRTNVWSFYSFPKWSVVSTAHKTSLQREEGKSENQLNRLQKSQFFNHSFTTTLSGFNQKITSKRSRLHHRQIYLGYEHKKEDFFSKMNRFPNSCNGLK